MAADEITKVKAELAECRQAEEELQLTKFSVDHAAIPAYLIGKDGRFLYANDQGRRALGYSREELLTMTVGDINPDYRPPKWQEHWADLKREGALHFETTHRRKDGEFFPVDVFVNFLEYAGREYNWAFARDISERRAAENALKQSYELTRTILDSMNDAISLIDVENFRIRSVNRVFLKEYGLADEAEVEGRFCFEVTHRREEVCAPPDDICPLAETLRTGEHFAVEHVHYGRQGERIYVEVSTSPIKDENGKVIQVVHVARNITARKAAEEALKRSEQRFRDIAEHAGEWIWEVDAAGQYTYASPVVKIILGYEPEEVLGQHFYDFFHPAVKEELTRKFFEVFARREAFRDVETLNMDRENRTVILATSGVPILREDGQLLGYRGVDRDITLSKQAEEELRISEARFRNFFQQSSISMQIYAPDGQCLEVNRAWEKLWGLTGDDVRYYNILEDSQLEGKGIAPHIRKGFAGEATEIPAVRYDPDEIGLRGRTRWVKAFIYPVKDEMNRVRQVVLMHLDITEQKEMEEIIRHQAFHDALTGLPNRRLFVDIVNLELARAKRSGSMFAVLFLDLDRFKYINDALGHRFGDELLKEVAGRLKHSVRESDSVARIGGDEFNILLGGITHTGNIIGIAGKIIEAFEEPYVINGHELQVATSIGISIYPEDAPDLETLFRNADMAMYHAKELGGNSYQFYDQEMNSRTLDRMRLDRWLQQSLRRNELEVYYQPMLASDTCKIICVEALVRWHHPEEGFLEPEHFMPLAEETGFITVIDEWVLRTACAQLKEWQQAGMPDICVAVNLSARQFQKADLAVRIASVLEEAGIDPSSLALEITESVIMGNLERATPTITRLADMGIGMGIDAFGTGYSSLSCLKKLPLHKLKIDKSFIKGIAIDADDRTIIKAVTGLALNMNLRVVAEGVETDEQLEFLRTIGCHEVQGDLFSRPLPAKEMAALITSRKFEEVCA